MSLPKKIFSFIPFLLVFFLVFSTDSFAGCTPYGGEDYSCAGSANLAGCTNYGTTYFWCNGGPGTGTATITWSASSDYNSLQG